MARVFAFSISLALLSGSAWAADSSVSVSGKGLCVTLPLIGTNCLTLPGLPSDPGSAAQPSAPANAVPGNLSSLPAAPQQDERKADTAAKSGGDSAPDYTNLTQYLFHFPDIRLETLPKGKIPYLSVNNTKVKGKNEWVVPYSEESGSIAAATAMRKAWQRFEDRYYWRAMVELNNPVLYLTNCIVDVNTGLQTKQISARVTVSPGDIGKDKKLDGKFSFSEPDTLALDSYYPIPQVKNADYCGDLSPNIIPEIPVMYLPGICFTFFGTPTGICIEGDRSNILNPAAPAPIYFNTGLARDRVAQAIKKAHTDYLKEYQQDVVNALFNKNNKYFFPLPWQSIIPGNGAVVAPVMNQSVTVQPFVDLANKVKNLYQGDKETQLFALNSFPYYFQSVYRSPTLSLHLLPKRKDVLASPPGVWLFEEYKRTLPVTNLAYQEKMGYTTFFQAFNEFKVALLPEDVGAKFLHPILYYATGILQDVTGATVILPQPMRLPEFTAGLPFAGVQGRYDWKSVPDGYAIPRVQGSPLFDYEVIR